MTTDPVSEDIREEIARIVMETMRKREWIVPPSVTFAVADALMPLVARIQAQALREAAGGLVEDGWLDAEEARMGSAWLRARADRLEQGDPS